MTRRVLAVATALLLGLLLSGGPGTTALFTDSDTISAGQFSTGGVLPPSAPTVTVATVDTRDITWSATTLDTGAGPQPVLGYEVYLYTAATGGTGTLVCSQTAGTSCTATGQPLSGFYAVRALTSFAWTAESARATPLGDTTKPTVAFNKWPTAGFTAKRDSFDTASVAACGTRMMACGEASDNVGVTGVTYILQRQQTGQVTYQCWNGGTQNWVDSTLACNLNAANTYSAVLATTGTTRVWQIPGNSDTKYKDKAATYTLWVTATDAAGNNSNSVLGAPVSITYTGT